MELSLNSYLRANNLTMGAAATICDVDRSMISKICSRQYHQWEQKEKELIAIMQKAGHVKSISDVLSVNTDVLVPTRSVNVFFDLCNSLIDPDSTLTSSIGMVIGTAERGKTHAARWYASENPEAVYTLYVDGFSRVNLLRNICFALAGVRPYSFGACVSTIAEVNKVSRKLIIVDEADKCPISILEMLRGVNESCECPIVLVGEEQLKSKIDSVPRLRSRIRKPVCLFEPITPFDIASYYSSALGLSIDRITSEQLAKRAKGGFRTVVNESIALTKIARASGQNTITPAMLDQLSA